MTDLDGRHDSTQGMGLDGESYCPTCDKSYPHEVQQCPADGTRLVLFENEHKDYVGRRIDDRFVIKERIGEGGMGTVYRAVQESVGREVAIKLIRPALSRDRATAKRFLRESKLASRLSQPNTVSVYDFGQTRDRMLYLVMELLVGRTLSEIYKQDGPFSAERAIRIGVQLCDALDAANRIHIIHRDLKPSNILILDDPPGRDLLKVLDFGLAKSLVEDETTTVTSMDGIVGTPKYMAPEVITGAPVDHRSDLYSLGVILYELVCGHPPFRATSIQAMYAQHTHATPLPVEPGVPDDLGAWITKLLSKNPADRYQTAAETRDALVVVRKRLLGSGDGSSAVSRTVTESESASADTVPAKRTRKREPAKKGGAWKWAAAVVAVLAMGLGGALALGVFGDTETRSKNEAGSAAGVGGDRPAADAGPAAAAETTDAAPAAPSAAIDAGAAAAEAKKTKPKKAKRSRRSRRSKRKKKPVTRTKPKDTEPPPKKDPDLIVPDP